MHFNWKACGCLVEQLQLPCVMYKTWCASCTRSHYGVVYTDVIKNANVTTHGAGTILGCPYGD